MAVAYQDFAPEITRSGFFTRDIEPLSDYLRRANDWIDTVNPRIINVETVVLPNIWSEDGSEDTDLRTSGDMLSSWHQFVRVWYEA